MATLNFVADLGQMMLESSSSVSEVTTRLRRLLAALGLSGCSMDADLSSLVLSYWHPDFDVPITTMRDVLDASPRLRRLGAASALLDRVESGTVGVREAADELSALRRLPDARRRFVWSALLLSVAGWVIFLHGFDAATIGVALVATLMTFPVAGLVRRLGLADISGTFLAAIVLAAVPNLAASAGIPIAVGPAVVGGLFIYLPGRMLVSSVLDGLHNAPLSSLARGLRALVTGGALAVGMLAGGTIGAGLGLAYVPDTTSVPLGFSVLGVALGILGLSIAWEMPVAQLAPAVVIGAGGWVVTVVVSQLGTGTNWLGYVVGAACIGAAGAVTAKLQNAPASLYTGVAILPLVPGFAIYQAMLALAEGQTTAGLNQLGVATIISLAVAAGVAGGLALTTNVLPLVRRRTPA